MSGRPGPVQDAESAPFWTGLRDGAVRLQACGNCHRTRFPPMATCPRCGSREVELVEAAETGTVYSWIIARRAFDPVFADEIPYVIATVDLDDGSRLVVRMDDADEIEFGMRVRTHIVHHAEWSELRVLPA